MQFTRTLPKPLMIAVALCAAPSPASALLICQTQIGSCVMAMMLPPGSSCICPSPVVGPVAGMVMQTGYQQPQYQPETPYEPAPRRRTRRTPRGSEPDERTVPGGECDKERYPDLC